MAAGTGSDFKIYQDQFRGGFVEKQMQNLQLINNGSRGAFSVRSEFLKGQYRQESFYPKIDGLVTRRDTTSVSAVADIPVTMDENVSVKLNRKIGPVAQTLDSWRKVGADPQTMSFVFGEQSADDSLADKLNTGISACAAALSNDSAVYFDATDGTLTHSDIARGLGKFGDNIASVIALVMHSKVWTDLMVQAITDKVDGVAGVVIQQGTVGSFNRPIIVTDSPALVVAGTPITYITLGLVSGAIEIVDSEVPLVESALVTGTENLIMRVQGEYAYNLAVKGYRWDITNGQANPNATAVGTKTNWDKTAASVKSLAGIYVKSQ